MTLFVFVLLNLSCFCLCLGALSDSSTQFCARFNGEETINVANVSIAFNGGYSYGHRFTFWPCGKPASKLDSRCFEHGIAEHTIQWRDSSDEKCEGVYDNVDSFENHDDTFVAYFSGNGSNPDLHVTFSCTGSATFGLSRDLGTVDLTVSRQFMMCRGKAPVNLTALDVAVGGLLFLCLVIGVYKVATACGDRTSSFSWLRARRHVEQYDVVSQDPEAN